MYHVICKVVYQSKEILQEILSTVYLLNTFQKKILQEILSIFVEYIPLPESLLLLHEYLQDSHS